MEIKDRIKTLRRENSMTQTQLAKQAGVTLRCIQNYESGTRYPRRPIIDKLSKIFNVSYEYLANGSQSIEIQDDAHEFLNYAGLIFAGGKLSEEDKDKVMLALQKIYWEAKEINNQKEQSAESENNQRENAKK